MFEVVVTEKSDIAQGICTIELEAVGPDALPPYTVGSHIDVHLPGGFVRQYSLCRNHKYPHRYLIAVLREEKSRGGSSAVHGLGAGQTLCISEPRNHFALVERAEHSVLVAGGIGITPILCMAEHLAQVGASFELHYTTRSADRVAFRERVESLQLAPQTQLYHDYPESDRRFDVGAVVGAPAPHKHLYVCGPAGLIDAVLTEARRGGWSSSNVHQEHFTAASPVDAAGTFAVKIASTGRIVCVPSGQTVVKALSSVGVNIPVSCEQGVCGTCVTRVLEGVPDHRDFYMTSDEHAANDRFLPCCSRAKTPLLVLDI